MSIVSQSEAVKSVSVSLFNVVLGYAKAVGLSLMIFALVACNPTSIQSNYLRMGIGAKLSADDIKKANQVQLAYFNYLCQQAGFGRISDIGISDDCITTKIGSDFWNIITYQGMNDIDRRCDAYLEWLDDRKRSRAPVLAQLGTSQNAATQILNITLGMTNAATAISIISQAFELITQSIENYHSRLLLEVNQSTINSIVLRARYNFRKDFQNMRVPDKPRAEYVLREYLRICLPFAIESVINDNSTLVSLGATPSDVDNASIHQTPIVDQAVGGALIKSIPDAGAEAVVIVTEKTAQEKFLQLSTNLSEAEKAINDGEPVIVQRALCVEDDAIFGDGTRAAIVQAKLALIAIKPDKFSNVSENLTNDGEISFFIRQSSCENHEMKWANAYEKYKYPTLTLLNNFQSALAKCDAAFRKAQPGTLKSNSFDEATRKMIKSVREKMEKHSTLKISEEISGSVSRKFDQQLSPCLTIAGK